MPSSSPGRRDVLLAVLALVLVSAPVWGPALQLDEPTYRYERLEVLDNGSTLEYAGDSVAPHDVRISDEIACSGGWSARPCGFEQQLVDNRTVPAGIYTTRANYTLASRPSDPYKYVLLPDGIYEPTYVVNRSAQREDGLYRVEMTLEAATPEEALRYSSVNVTWDSTVSSVAAEAARTGRATARHQADIPETPIRLENGSSYRVYLAETHDDVPPIAHVLEDASRYVAPLVGLFLFYGLSRRINITYTGSD